jgi:hypothetical protein
VRERRLVLPRRDDGVRTLEVTRPPEPPVSLVFAFVVVLAILIGAVLWAIFGRGK